MLKAIEFGRAVSFATDRMSISDQEISFLESEDFVSSFNHSICKLEPYLKDPNVKKIFWRAHTLCSLATQIAVGRKEISFVECGTHLGLMVQTLLHFFRIKKSACKIKSTLFDTWDGIPENQIQKEETPAHWHNQNNYTNDSFPFIQQMLAEFEDVHLVRGQVPETLTLFPNRSLDILHLDMNIVYPEAAALRFFWPKIRRGGFLLIDDYGFSGHTLQRKFYDEFFSVNEVIPCQLPTGQAVVFKQGL